MGMQLTGIDRHFGSVLPTMDIQPWYTDTVATRSSFIRIQDRQLVVIPGISINYFDVHRVQPQLANSLERQIDPRSMKFAGPEGASNPVSEPSSDEEEDSTDADSDQEDPTVAWCPPIPDATEDPSEAEIASAADKLAILLS